MNINLTLIGQSISMIVFVGLCMKYIWPPIVEGLEARRKQIADGLAEADKATADLAAAQAKSQDIIRDARTQANQIVDQATNRGNQVVEEAKQDAVAERGRQLEAAKAEIELESTQAREALRDQVAALALAAAEKIVEREINADDHRDIIDRMVAEL